MPNSRFPGKRCISLWLTKEEIEKLESAAKHRGFNRSELINNAINEFIHHHDLQKIAKNTEKLGQKKNPGQRENNEETPSLRLDNKGESRRRTEPQ